MLGVYGAYVGPTLLHVRLLEAILGTYSRHVGLMLSQERRVPLKNFNFEGVTRWKFAAVGYRFPPQSGFQRLKIRKPPAEFQDVCPNTFCAVRAALQLEDFNVEGLARRPFAVRRGFHCGSWLSIPPSQVCMYILFMTFIIIRNESHGASHSLPSGVGYFGRRQFKCRLNFDEFCVVRFFLIY